MNTVRQSRELRSLLFAGALALLSGAFGAAQQAADPAKAHQSACASNLYQLSKAMLMYAQDYDNRLPPADRWSRALLPYYKSAQTLSCPADGKADGYALNRNLSGADLKRVAKPAETVLLFESDQHKPNASGTREAAAETRHAGGSNFAYVDGHVKWSKGGPGGGGPDFGKPMPAGTAPPKNRK